MYVKFFDIVKTKKSDLTALKFLMEIRTKQLMDHHVRSLDKPVWLKFQLRQLFNVAYTETYFQNEGSKLKKHDYFM